MKRRSFIIGSFLCLAGAGAFPFMQWVRSATKTNALARPQFLSQLCDSNTIRSLGRAYLKLRPNEIKEEVLLKDLLPEGFRKDFPENKEVTIAEFQIEKRIKYDFDTGNIVVVQGWVLSVTEARQCAYFSKT